MTKPFLDRQTLTRQEVFLRYKLSSESDAARRYALARLIDRGDIVHAGRDQYYLKDSIPGKYAYTHQYSDHAIEITKLLCNRYPLLDWRIFETASLNEFVNHQIAQNTVFVEAEPMLVESVYETLRGRFAEKVIVKPKPRDLDYYWTDNAIIVMRLVSEAPKDDSVPYGTTIEKLLVDLFTNKILGEMISPGEYAAIIEGAFDRYIVDGAKMFRYARRRNAETRMKDYLRQNTQVRLTADR